MFDGASWPVLDRTTVELIDATAVIAVNKCDLGAVADAPTVAGAPAIALSCLTGRGIPAVVEALCTRARELLSAGDEPLLTRARHRAALADAAEALARFAAATPEIEIALLAEELRLAARAIGRLTGEVAVDDILDQIFAEFCIGK
jgi:tRNA modification GTPase